MTYAKGDRVKVKGRRGVHTIHSHFAKNEGWWCIGPDGGRWVPVRPDDLRPA